MFASDRGNPRLADRYDVLSPPVLAFLSSVIAQASRAGVPVSLCGEMAGHPLEAMALVGLGMRTISMPPSAIGPVKTMTRSLELAPLQRYLRSLLDVPDHSVREKLRMFANDHSVVI
jgi:phosphotransferase system enzyme I (PtsP)